MFALWFSIVLISLGGFLFLSKAHAETIQDQVYKIAPAFGQNPEVELAIRHCESHVGKPIHFNKDGSFDIGEMQINSIHLPEAKSLGIDLYTTRGNIVFSSWMLQQYGTIPWNASKKCWSKLV